MLQTLQILLIAMLLALVLLVASVVSGWGPLGHLLKQPLDVLSLFVRVLIHHLITSL